MMLEPVVPSSEKTSRPVRDDQRARYQEIGRRAIEVFPEDRTPAQVAAAAEMSVDDFGAFLVGEYSFTSTGMALLAEALQVDVMFLLTGEQPAAQVIACRVDETGG